MHAMTEASAFSLGIKGDVPDCEDDRCMMNPTNGLKGKGSVTIACGAKVKTAYQ